MTINNFVRFAWPKFENVYAILNFFFFFGLKFLMKLH